MTPFRDTYWNVPDWAVVLMYLLLVGLAMPAFFYQIYRRIQLWRQGQPVVRSDHLGERLGWVLRYAVAQLRILAQKFSGLMHLGIFWGMVLLFIGTLLVMLEQDFTRVFFGLQFLKGTFYLGFEVVLDVFGLFLTIGLLMAVYRRYVGKWERLGNERAFAFTLVSLLIIAVTGFMLEAFRLAVVRPEWEAWSPVGLILAGLVWNVPEASLRTWHLWTWLFHMVFVGAFIAALPQTNLMHLVTTPLNIFFDRREPKPGVLTPIDLEAAEFYGVGEIGQFTWKQRLGFDACTYCGRCQAACPAYAAGMPLSPKNVIARLSKYMINPPVPFASSAPSPLIGEDGVIHPDELWACTTCIACITECPVFIEIVEDIVDMRRYLALSEGALKPTAAAALTQVERQGNPWGYPAADRTNWADGLDVPLAEAGQEYDVLYWVGCSSAYDARNQNIARALVKIMRAAGLKFAIMAEEQCSGDGARRLGNEYLFQMLAQTNVENLNQYQFKRIVAACPHCFNVLKNEYPQFGGNYQVVHHSQLIQELLQQGRIRLKPGAARRITFHDSCYLGRYNHEYQAPRAAIAALPGVDMVEMRRSRQQGLCCGGGGGNMWMEVEGKTRINYVRFEDALEVNPQMIGTSCPFCLTMLDDARKVKGVEDKIGVKDIAELVAEAMEAGGDQ
jgi:Fe-S oxidoreductase/nitrate reductase gamma subunit